MRQELDDKLVKDFPLLYADRYASVTQSCMPWGFDVGDGWFDIVYELSSKLENFIKNFKSEVCEFCYYAPNECPCPEFKPLRPKAVQVKEKFGLLRFYMSHSSDEIDEYIRAAVAKSKVTCELCGAEGKLVGEVWLSVRCAPCEAEDEARRVAAFKKATQPSKPTSRSS